MEIMKRWTMYPFRGDATGAGDLVVKTSENREGERVVLVFGHGITEVSSDDVAGLVDSLGPAELEFASTDGLVFHPTDSISIPDETDEAEAWLDSLDPAETPAEDPRDLRRIGLAQRALEDAEQDLRNSVAAARAAGRSWAEVGRSLGVTRQAAQMRFGKTAAPAHA